MTNDLLSLTQDLTKAALSAGAEQADALLAQSTGTEVDLLEGALEKLERTESTQVSLRVFHGHSSAIVSGSVLTREAMQRLAERAVAMARLAPPDPFAGLAETSQLAQHLESLDLVSLARPEAKELTAMAQAVEEAALGVPGVSKSGGASATIGLSQIALVTSRGFAKSYLRSSFSFSVSAIAGADDNMERDYDYTAACHFSDLRKPQDVGTEAGRRAVARLAPRQVSSQSVPVIYDRRIASSLLGHLSSAINGAAIARGTSFLKSSLGSQIFSPGITITDDPLRRRGLASRPFDGEGLPVSRRDMVKDGILQGWTLDLRSARQLGLEPTGQASRGLSSPPSPSLSNFYLAPGTSSLDELIRGVSRGLYVTELMGSSVNLVTGDYSRGASGFWIENGEIAYPVSGITIAGKLTDMYRQLTPANDLVFAASSNAPSCLIEVMTVAGR